jgi:ATP-dependent exoDNAse (exonuclease V) beta subunit
MSSSDTLNSATFTSPASSPVQLTPEQSVVVHTWGQGISVVAGAGSGKTFTLVQKVRALLEKNPESRLAAVSFTEKSARDLREKLTELSFELRGEGLRGHWVTTIHGLCAHVLKEFPREAGFDGTETQLTDSESSELWQKSIEVLWFEELPEEVDAALEACLDRDTRENLVSLLARVRDLSSLGLFERFNDQNLILVARYVLYHYVRLKKRESVIDFQDLEEGARRALSHESVRRHYRKVFDLVLVDEFQDTNPSQSEILTAFCREEFTNLCVVGDPKQSIYRFRDADVSVFEEFCAKLPVHVVLNRNYRSRQGVLDFCNAVCEPVFSASSLAYEALIPTRPNDEEVPPILHVPVDSPKAFADFLWGEKAKGADFSEMVMLLRKVRGRAEVWMKALVESGIPVAVESGGLLWTDPRAREIASFLRFWAFPKDEMAGVTFLRAPWVNLLDPQFEMDAQIDEWKFNRKISLWEGFISSEHRLAKRFSDRVHPKMRPGEMLSLLLEDDLLCDSLGTILLSLWHQCEELSTRGYTSFEVIQELTRRLKAEAREKGIPPPEALGQLRVMTVHGSKGLEFKRVILIDFEPKAERAAHSPLLFWDRKKGAYLVERDEDGNKDRSNPNVKAWSAWEKEQLLAESKRIFYVALTRAKDQLIFVVRKHEEPPAPAKTSRATKEKEKVNPLLVDCWRGWVEDALKHAPLAVVEGRTGNRSESDSHSRMREEPRLIPPFAVRRPRHSVSELLKFTRCPRLYAWSVIEEREESIDLNPKNLGDRPLTRSSENADGEDEVPFNEMIEDDSVAETSTFSGRQKLTAREVGTRVHQALEDLDPSAIELLAEEIGEGSFPVSSILEFMREEKVARESGERQSWNELAFEIPIRTSFSREACVGAADRVEFDPRTGIYTVIDYKVLRVPATNASLLDRYGFQLKCYAWAVARLANVPVEKVRAELVVFHGKARRISVPVGEDRFQELAEDVALLLQKFSEGKGEAIPHSGMHCQRCGFLSQCEAGQKAIMEK